MSSRPHVNPKAKAASPTRQVRLSGPTPALDPRVHAFRPDLADLALAGRIVAPNYAQAVAMRCTTPNAMLRSKPRSDAGAVSELLHGETFNVLELSGGWAWGWCAHDRYVGYVAAAALAPGGPAPTHRVSASAGLVFTQADIASPVVATLPLGAVLAATGQEGSFLALADGGFVHARHVSPLASKAGDPLAVAETFLGAPYLWGGRTRWGVDCSGLIQAALMACGIAAPRDSDQQRAAIGRLVAAQELTRGDLVFFPGHVGIMCDERRLLHANAFWMATVIEPLADVIDRLRSGDGEPTVTVRRV